MFEKILIANRGEIACRVMRTAQSMGIECVAVYSVADAHAPFVMMADEAVMIGEAPAAESYLVADKILAAAKETGAQAIHPGYGFLSENADFADACEAANIVFIGPSAETMRQMGSKSAAKDLMEAAKVPTSPGYQGKDQSYKTFKSEANRIGYPVLLKAVSGGGGKGMRLVTRDSELEEAMQSAQREGQSSFGDDRLLIEKYIEKARHLEVQIFGDGNGNVVHCFERDCSVQRRHQKIIEEAPAPNLSANVRDKLLKAGVAAGKAVNYRNAGTVEFLYDGGENVYFMEMNTRLQVEHPVSEEITGFDFVEWQLRIAAGEAIPATQDDIECHGYAFESRIYAEDTTQNFAPSIGRLTTLNFPDEDEFVRIDSGVREGQEITPFYDPMIAKLITYGSNRKEALGIMRGALGKTQIAGLETNVSFLAALAGEKDFIDGEVSTSFIEEHEKTLFAEGDFRHYALAAWVVIQRNQIVQNTDDIFSPWKNLQGWRLNRPFREVLWIERDGDQVAINISVRGDDYEIRVEPIASAQARRQGQQIEGVEVFTFKAKLLYGDQEGAVRVTLDNYTRKLFVASHHDGFRVFDGAKHMDIIPANPLVGPDSKAASGGSLSAPMPGSVTALLKDPGEKVESGETLMVMEAMKMEHSIKAPSDGVLKAYRFSVGDQVSDGDLLVEFEETE